MSSFNKLLTPEALSAILNMFGEKAGWSQGGANSATDLFNEINAGECRIIIDDTGLHREISIVRMEIQNNELGYLLHEKTILLDGSVRELNVIPCGKIRKGEYPIEAFAREAQEELDLDLAQTSRTRAPKVTFEEKTSSSYPGLRTIYMVHLFQVFLNDPALEKYKNGWVQQEKDGKILHFGWHKDLPA